MLINGKSYPTHVVRGRPHFVANSVVKRFLSQNNNPFCYNQGTVAIDYKAGMFSLDEMIQFHTMAGIAVDDLLERPWMQGVSVYKEKGESGWTLPYLP